MNKGRFKKGQTPWNKGKAHPASGRSQATQFKPGNIPATARQEGEVYIREDKGRPYWYIKPIGARHVELYHRYLWKQQHGEIPKGHIVTFRDFDSLNVHLDNLICISRSEHLRRQRARLNTLERTMSAHRAWMKRKDQSWVDRVLSGVV